tara:strand:- start:853 stop:1347 length:495 start_codon:yes stop_codon:yes gene_type:complete
MYESLPLNEDLGYYLKNEFVECKGCAQCDSQGYNGDHDVSIYRDINQYPGLIKIINIISHPSEEGMLLAFIEVEQIKPTRHDLLMQQAINQAARKNIGVSLFMVGNISKPERERFHQIANLMGYEVTWHDVYTAVLNSLFRFDFITESSELPKTFDNAPLYKLD